MNKEYLCLKEFKKSYEYDAPYHTIISVVEKLHKTLSRSEAESEISSFLTRKLIEEFSVGRFGLSENGIKYLDETFCLEQSYEIVDNILVQLLEHNSAINVKHERGCHKIEYKVKEILEENKLIKYLISNKVVCLVSILPKGRKVIEVFFGCEKYFHSLQVNIESQSVNVEMELQINVLTLENLQYLKENRQLKSERELDAAQLVKLHKREIKQKPLYLILGALLTFAVEYYKSIFK